MMTEITRWVTWEKNGSEIIFRCFWHEKQKNTSENQSLKPQVKFSDGWWYSFCATQSTKSSDWKMDFDNVHPTPFSIIFHFHFRFSYRFWRTVRQEWSCTNITELLIIKSHRSTVSTQKFIILKWITYLSDKCCVITESWGLTKLF